MATSLHGGPTNQLDLLIRAGKARSQHACMRGEGGRVLQAGGCGEHARPALALCTDEWQAWEGAHGVMEDTLGSDHLG